MEWTTKSHTPMCAHWIVSQKPSRMVRIFSTSGTQHATAAFSVTVFRRPLQTVQQKAKWEKLKNAKRFNCGRELNWAFQKMSGATLTHPERQRCQEKVRV